LGYDNNQKVVLAPVPVLQLPTPSDNLSCKINQDFDLLSHIPPSLPIGQLGAEMQQSSLCVVIADARHDERLHRDAITGFYRCDARADSLDHFFSHFMWFGIERYCRFVDARAGAGKRVRPEI
jgi:hypothetical protein